MTPSGRVAVRSRVLGGPGVQAGYLHQDALGSVCALTDETGQRKRLMAYDP